MEQFRVVALVGIQTLDQIATGVRGDLAGQRDSFERIEGPRVEFEAALVFQFPEDVPLDHLQGGLGVDEVVMK